MTEYVTLVPQGGQPVRLGNQVGAPWPTTGTGSLVFAEGATLTNVTLTGVTGTLAQTARLQTATASSAATVIDWRLGTYCIITLAANTAIEFDPLPDSLVVTMTLLFIQDGTGNHTVTFSPVTSGFTTVYTEDGQQPLIQPTAATRTELQAVLDPTSDTLRIRQGVIGEIAVA